MTCPTCGAKLRFTSESVPDDGGAHLEYRAQYPCGAEWFFDSTWHGMEGMRPVRWAAKNKLKSEEVA